MLWR
jgi:DDE family transposase